MFGEFGYPLGHAGFLAVALATHAVVGYTLGAVLFDAPRAGLVGGVVADADFLFPAALGFPFVHRGLTHTALALGVAVAVAYRWNGQVAGAVGVGYASQLLIDVTTPKGIPVAYPLSAESVVVPINAHSTTATVLLWAGCLVALWHERRAID